MYQYARKWRREWRQVDGIAGMCGIGWGRYMDGTRDPWDREKEMGRLDMLQVHEREKREDIRVRDTWGKVEEVVADKLNWLAIRVVHRGGSVILVSVHAPHRNEVSSMDAMMWEIEEMVVKWRQ